MPGLGAWVWRNPVRDAGMSSFFGAPPRGAGSPTPGDNEVVEMDRAVNVVMKVMAEKEQLQKDYDALREEMPGHDITLGAKLLSSHLRYVFSLSFPLLYVCPRLTRKALVFTPQRRDTRPEGFVPRLRRGAV